MNPETHTLTGAYVLNALSPTERAAFEEHRSACVLCDVETTELTETVARLGLAAAEPAPPELKQRVLTRAAHTRQLPPRAARVADHSTREALVETPRGVHGRDAVGTGSEQGAHDRFGPTGGWEPGAGRAGGGRGSRRRWITPVLIAACLAAAAGSGLHAIRLTEDLTRTTQERQRVDSELDKVNTILTSPDTRLLTSGVDQATATIAVSRAQGRLLLMTRDLPALPADRAYQAWMITPGGPHSAGLLAKSAEPSPLVTDLVPDTGTVGITVEPASGSPAPTTQPIMIMKLPL